ncbi:cold-shock protein [Plasmodium brasilianum]|uniref:Cold-shock protein, putative n=2 Tax=Plasmodium (Plasmodium) TaxID=418103 RepID=A0A1D3JKM1_PLAMA|nr:cold-shock protein, putative [Plasmodium malariae]KAI4840904.1 cold-shock protein [Plasmodium brasilianum]SBT87099.1 cold-shock protein, putative [Plasmodium malariae]
MFNKKLPKKLNSNFFSFSKTRLFSELVHKEKHDKITGNVIKFDRRKGYGFIKPNDGGPDIFVHYTDIFLNRNFYVSSDEKKKLLWNSNVNLGRMKDNFDFENDSVKKKDEIKKEFKYLIPGERVKFSVIYDEKNHSSKAVNVEYLE